MSVLSLLKYKRVSTEDLNLDACSSLKFLVVTFDARLVQFWPNDVVVVQDSFEIFEFEFSVTVVQQGPWCSPHPSHPVVRCNI